MKQEEKYEAPRVETIEVEVEKGFEGSGSSISDLENGGLLGAE